ncbi:MAG: DNA replication/repair protein RecF [Anaerovoracaceae bacterium]
MYIKRIILEKFRNYDHADISFDPRVNIFLGDNAQGKTNLLESIYLTSTGKSFRTTKEKELIKFNEEFCRIRLAYFREEDGSIDIAINRNGKKLGKVNGIKIEKNAEILDNVLAVIFSPEDLKIVKEEPEKRRKFIDRELSQLKLSYYRNLNVYQKVLNQRNVYLKEKNIDLFALSVWDEKLAEYGKRLIEDRAWFIQKLDKISKKIHWRITEGKEELQLTYAPSISSNEDFLAILLEGQEKDRYHGNTAKGPHKDDFEVSINGINARKFGSQGQLRTAALSLKMAEIELIKEEKNEFPILLLDDVLSELDYKRQRMLIHSFKEVQLFITTAEISDMLLESLPGGKKIFIQEGRISQL